MPPQRSEKVGGSARARSTKLVRALLAPFRLFLVVQVVLPCGALAPQPYLGVAET